jgi:hypothetical protein
MSTGQPEAQAAKEELARMLGRFEAMRRDTSTSKDDLARLAGEIRALTQSLRAMTDPKPGAS